MLQRSQIIKCHSEDAFELRFEGILELCCWALWHRHICRVVSENELVVIGMKDMTFAARRHQNMARPTFSVPPPSCYFPHMLKLTLFLSPSLSTLITRRLLMFSPEKVINGPVEACL